MTKSDIFYKKFMLIIAIVMFFTASQANASYYDGLMSDVLSRQEIKWNMNKSISDEDVAEVFNSLPVTNFKRDFKNYNVIEYWAIPSEFERNSGDCEDAAIWWAYKLAERGIGRLQIYTGMQGIEPHAVLVVNNKWVLDVNARKPILLSEFKGMTIDIKVEVL